MTREQLDQLIKERFGTKRYGHTLGVVKVAQQLAVHYNQDVDVATTAAYLHDYGKIFKGQRILSMAQERGLVTHPVYQDYPELLHAKLGATLVKEELGITDQAILSAIAAHCYGSTHMSLMDKIIYLADYIEPNRRFEGIEKVRKMVYKDLDKALLMAVDGTLVYVIERGLPIHATSVEMRNRLLLKKMED